VVNVYIIMFYNRLPSAKANATTALQLKREIREALLLHILRSKYDRRFLKRIGIY